MTQGQGPPLSQPNVVQACLLPCLSTAGLVNSEAQRCLFFWELLEIQKSSIIYRSSESSDCGAVSDRCFASKLLSLLCTYPLPPTPRGNQEKQDSTCPGLQRLLGNAGIVTISGRNGTIHRTVNTGGSVEWQKIMK